MDIQKMLDAFGDGMRRTRSQYHLTLGALIERLSQMPAGAIVRFDCNGNSPGDADSYRGYYADLAFEPSGKAEAVAQFLARSRAALGETFTGYKGGDYVMDEDTPLWVASYGTSVGSRAIIDIVERDGIVILITKEAE